MKTEAWESQKHPFFRDRVIYNKELFKLYHEGKIGKKDVAAVLETSEDYIDWVINKIEKVEQIKQAQSGGQSSEDMVSASEAVAPIERSEDTDSQTKG